MTPPRNSAAADLAAWLRNSPDVRIGDLGGLNLDADALERNAGSLGGATVEPGRVSQSVILPLPPSANRYWRKFGGRMVVSPAAKAYKQGAWLQAQHAGLHPFGGTVAVYLHVYRAIRRGDLDNFAKIVLDALCGVAYQDDEQIVELHAYRYDDKANPRVEVEIRQVAP